MNGSDAGAMYGAGDGGAPADTAGTVEEDDGKPGWYPYTSSFWHRLFGRTRTLLLLLWEVLVREVRGARYEDGRRCF